MQLVIPSATKPLCRAAYIREAEHCRNARQQRLFIELKEFHTGIQEYSFQNSARDEGRLVACTEEKSDQGIDHTLAEIGSEAEEAEHGTDGNECEDDLEHSAPQSANVACCSEAHLMIFNTRPNLLMSFSKERESCVG